VIRFKTNKEDTKASGKANPDAKDLFEAGGIAKDVETSPSPTARPAGKTGMLGRVADAGNLGQGNPSPYEAEIQADVVAGETRHDDPSAAAKTKRPRKRA
jgi:hypothetical protein